MTLVLGGRRQRRRLLVVDGLHVLVQGRPAVERGRADRATKDHLANLHDVGRRGAPVLLGVTVRHVFEEGVGVVEVDVAVVAIVVGPASSGHDSLSVLLLQLEQERQNFRKVRLGKDCLDFARKKC